jgi:RHS repeat-associated protein
MSDSTGTTISSIKYMPFGDRRNSQGTIATDKQFTGQRLDGTGLYYYNARYYDPAIGRFISADDVQDYSPQSLNRYSYNLNNPLKYIDPSGHKPVEPDDYAPSNQPTDPLQLWVFNQKINRNQGKTEKINPYERLWYRATFKATLNSTVISNMPGPVSQIQGDIPVYVIDGGPVYLFLKATGSRAVTLYPDGIFILEEDFDSTSYEELSILMAEELYHWYEQQNYENTTEWYWNYFYDNITKGYENNPFEQRAKDYAQEYDKQALDLPS